ncbi:unnamed protein product [Polarella glacialis]|uniref:Uncharacterized protein n=1 Tax=Polarella glacialis TaxID=89957 RepID=A0A813F9Z2_POLGL|nr:unnamed protein product [Polarella glacialis]
MACDKQGDWPHLLHKLHFVHNKGAGAVSEIIEAPGARNPAGQMSGGSESTAKGWKACMLKSTSIWTKEERDRIEERRQDPVEAKAKMNGHMKELAQTYFESKTAIAGRVGARAAMNVRSQEDWAEIQAVRQDPEEAAAKMRTHLKELASSYREEKAAMTARLQTSPKQSFWSKEKMAKMQQARQDPEEAAEKMTQLLQRRSMAWMEEKATRIQNLNNLPVMSFWTPEEVAQIELARQDPEEAKAKMKQHMHELETTARERKTDMLARVQASPRMPALSFPGASAQAARLSAGQTCACVLWLSFRERCAIFCFLQGGDAVCVHISRSLSLSIYLSLFSL